MDSAARDCPTVRVDRKDGTTPPPSHEMGKMGWKEWNGRGMKWKEKEGKGMARDGKGREENERIGNEKNGNEREEGRQRENVQPHCDHRGPSPCIFYQGNFAEEDYCVSYVSYYGDYE